MGLARGGPGVIGQASLKQENRSTVQYTYSADLSRINIGNWHTRTPTHISLLHLGYLCLCFAKTPQKL